MRQGVALNDLSIALGNYWNLCVRGDTRHICDEITDGLRNETPITFSPANWAVAMDGGNLTWRTRQGKCHSAEIREQMGK